MRKTHAIFAGILTTLGFAPLHLWPLTLFGLSTLFGSDDKPFQKGGCFGLGFFGSGVYWIVYSIHDYGHNAWPLSLCLTLLFISYLSLFPACALALSQKSNHPHRSLISCWVLLEWLRSHLFTGFPWLLLGYSQSTSPLSFFAPYLGVYGLGALTLFLAYMLHQLMQSKDRLQACYLCLILALSTLTLSYLNQPKHRTLWTHPDASSKTFALVQGNLTEKWQTPIIEQIRHYQHLSPKSAEIVLWPEVALPYTSPSILKHLEHFFKNRNQRLITGLLSHPNDGTWYNSVAFISTPMHLVHKRHLVPFGEFIPNVLRPFLPYLPLGMSDMTPGALNQTPLTLQDLRISALICFEVTFPDLTRTLSSHQNLLIVFNDSHWFGPSFAASEQLEMAKMRVLELQKPLLYISNTGWTLSFDHLGHVKGRLPMNQAGAIQVKMIPYQGHTPYADYGESLILIGLVLSHLCAAFYPKKPCKKDG